MKHKLGNYGVAADLLSHCQMTSIYQLYTFLPRYKPKNRPIFFIHIVDSMHTFTPRSEVDNSPSGRYVTILSSTLKFWYWGQNGWERSARCYSDSKAAQITCMQTHSLCTSSFYGFIPSICCMIMGPWFLLSFGQYPDLPELAAASLIHSQLTCDESH